jgi:hypothetical protein
MGYPTLAVVHNMLKPPFPVPGGGVWTLAVVMATEVEVEAVKNLPPLQPWWPKYLTTTKSTKHNTPICWCNVTHAGQPDLLVRMPHPGGCCPGVWGGGGERLEALYEGQQLL